MRKKPVLAETNRKQNVSNKIPGAFNSRPKSSHAIQYAEKSIQHDSSPIISQAKEKKLATPKTKFTSQDRSAEFCPLTSSRIKNFPAEELKRIKCSPKAKITTPIIQRPEHPQQQLLSHEIIHGKGDGLFNHFPPPNPISSNNQHHLLHPECHQNGPDIIIPSSYLRSTRPQVHRPFVPIPRASHGKEPQVTTSLIMNPGPSDTANNCKEEKKEIVTEFPQVQENEKKIDKILKQVECEKQPVGGRSAFLHRLKHITQKEKTESLKVRRISSFPQNQIPRQLKNSEENIPRCNFPQENYVEDHYSNVYNAPRPADQNIHGPMVYPQNQMMNPMLNQSNIVHQHPEGSNFYTETNYPSNFQNNMYDKNIKRNQKIHPKPQQIQNKEYPPRRPSTTKIKKPKEKNYQFTPAMIHDQELLVTKMKQQGVNEDIMKRQFDALLNEQKRQLMYRQQLEEPEEFIEDNKVSVRKKVFKIEEDRKPEWMDNITPSKIPCVTPEKTNQSTSKQKNNKSVKFNDQKKQLESENGELYPFSTKNGLQNTNYNFPSNVYQPIEQNMMIITADGQQHCNCHHCNANYQNYFIQQHQELPYGNNRYYQMQHSVQPQQNFPIWPNNYVMNNHPNQYYANNFINTNPNIPHNNLPQYYSDEGPVKNIENKFIRNNGLQDDKSVKKAMEELKSRESHKGYEYLANLNNPDKRLVLNGTQDPEDEQMKNFSFRQQPTENVGEVKKELRANGLENRRNPNNPPPPPNLHMKNFDKPFREYPKRKDELSAENYDYITPKNMIDGNLLSIDGKEYQLILPAPKSIYNDSRRNPFMAQVYQVQGQNAGPYDYQNGYQLIRSNSMPSDINFHRYQYQGSSLNPQAIEISEKSCKHGAGNLNSNSNDNEHLNSYNYVPKMNNNVLINQNNLSNCPGVYQVIEPRVIGGIKYFARKLNYAPNSNNCSYQMDDRI